MTRTTAAPLKGAVARVALFAAVVASAPDGASSRLADRSRLVGARVSSGKYDRHRDNGRPIAGPGYRANLRKDAEEGMEDRDRGVQPGGGLYQRRQQEAERRLRREEATAEGGVEDEAAGWGAGADGYFDSVPQLAEEHVSLGDWVESTHGRRLSSQLTGCCSTYSSYSASDMCGLYGQDCDSGEQSSHDSGDDTCEQDGLSFIGVSFSVNTPNGNPYSYQLCDQFPMENIIDRNYDYIMSMDEDGWLVGGGYKQFDYSGKMPYIDSSHTELLRIGSMDTDMG